MDDVLTLLTNRIAARCTASKQLLVGIAGPPGSGKSTIATELVIRLQHAGITSAALSLDGFHYPRSHLLTLPNAKAAFATRGSPWTFDIDALREFVKHVRMNADRGAAQRAAIIAPTFDHALKDPIIGGLVIPPDTEVVVIEHVYLLLSEDKWRDLSAALDWKVMIEVDRDIARERVSRRHVAAGIEPTLALARSRYNSNDGLNGERVRANIVGYDQLIQSVDV